MAVIDPDLEDDETYASNDEEQFDDEGPEADGDEDAGDGDDDDGSSNDRSEDDDAETDEGEEEEEEQAPVKQSRGRNAVQRAKDEAKAAREEAANVRRELEQIRQAQNQKATETEEQRRRRLADMEPEDRVLYLAKERSDQLEARLNQLTFQTLDGNDRAAFQALCAENPHFKSVSKEVEAELQKQRAQGVNLSRETLAKYILGERIAARIGDAKQKQGDAAKAAKRKQRAKPTGSRSDVSAKGGRLSEAEARRKRLEDMSI